MAANTDIHNNRGRPRVLQSCVALLDAFEFYYHHLPSELIDWTIGQQALNACMILLLDMYEARDLRHREKVDIAYAIFFELDAKGVHKLAKLAVSRISRESLRLREAVDRQWGPPISASSSSTSLADRSGTTVPSGTGSFAWSQHSSQSEYSKEYQNTAFGQQYHEPIMTTTGMFLVEDTGLLYPTAASFHVVRRDSQHQPSTDDVSWKHRSGATLPGRPVQTDFAMPVKARARVGSRPTSRRPSVITDLPPQMYGSSHIQSSMMEVRVAGSGEATGGIMEQGRERRSSILPEQEQQQQQQRQRRTEPHHRQHQHDIHRQR